MIPATIFQGKSFSRLIFFRTTGGINLSLVSIDCSVCRRDNFQASNILKLLQFFKDFCNIFLTSTKSSSQIAENINVTKNTD